jgi:glyoxylase-like metal-dependent hydrolase (beta-lactamase superfamily II)
VRVDVLNLRIIPGIPHKRNIVRVFLVESKGIHVLVDAGCPWHGPKISSWLSKKGVKPTVLLITHAHLDHFGAAGYLHTLYPGLKIYAPKASHHTLNVGRVVVPENLGGIPKWLVPLYRAAAQRIRLNEIHPEGEGSELEPLGLKVIPTPGHSRDHTSLLLEDGTLLAGDALCEPPSYANPFCDDPEESLESVRKLAALDPKRIIPSHHPEFRGPIRLK